MGAIENRHEGTVSKWDDARGFGYITPVGGGREVFAHISAWPRGSGRPDLGDFVTFTTERAPDGRTRAGSVRRPYERVHRSAASADVGGAAYIAVAGFVALYVLVGSYWPVSPWMAVFYAVASVITFIAYARDKAAARAGRWRTSENVLHLLGLAGGWPGAIFAQRRLHHKNRKASFQGMFWVTVVVNAAAFVVVVSPRFVAGATKIFESVVALQA
ncbi:MAG: cold shock and DUF1294 domain-containing protein [Lacisediminihabitans sp.]